MTTKIQTISWLNPWKSRLGFRYMQWLDKRTPGLCWADLVLWMYFHPWDFGHLRDDVLSSTAEGPARCKADMRETGACYCGKWMTADARGQMEAAAKEPLP
tara:strand:+ start:170 stop:472 length:303 start_codon:yes stop_codon:yes gene_type:complete